jgi:tetratricopeptide (TPR) repeat protein
MSADTKPAFKHCTAERQAASLLRIARASGNPAREGLALADLGVAYTRAGKPREAMPVFKHALELARSIGDRNLHDQVCGDLGEALLRLGESARAMTLFQGNLAYARQSSDRFAERTALERLGNAYSRAKGAARAAQVLEEAQRLAHELGDRRGEADLLWQCAIEYAELDQREEVHTTGERAIALLTALNHPYARLYADYLEKYRNGDNRAIRTASELQAADQSGSGAEPAGTAGKTGPGLLRMAIAAAKAMGKFIASGLQIVTAQVHRARLQTCKACRHHTGARCRVCGCFTFTKAKLPYESCPLGKWPT